MTEPASPVVPVTVTIEPGGGARAAVSGELDMSTAGALRAELWAVLESRPGRLEIDCAAVPMIDSAGIVALVAAQREGERIGCPVVIGPDGCRVTELFQVLRLPVENEVVPAATIVRGAGDDRAPVDPVRAGAVLGHAEPDIEMCFRSIAQGYGDALDLGVRTCWP